MKALPDGDVGEGTPASGTSVTIYDVARRAGVGIATVSRAIRGSAPVSDATRARVLAAVDELGFRPSHLGTSLAARRHAASGIVVPTLSSPYCAEVVLGYEEVAAGLGRSVLVLSTDGRTDPGAAVRELAGRIDGLLILGRTVSDALVEELTATGLPVVVLARPQVGDADCVRVNNRATARDLGRHLRAHGYRSACLLGSSDSSHDVSERWAGLRDGLGDARTNQVSCDLDEQAGWRAACGVLRSPARPEVLACATDEVALGAIIAAEQAGLRVGVDVAITGWDDVMAARHSRPGLTTVRQPMRRLGARAATSLDERITRTRTVPRIDELPTELVVRSSCGPHA